MSKVFDEEPIINKFIKELDHDKPDHNMLMKYAKFIDAEDLKKAELWIKIIDNEYFDLLEILLQNTKIFPANLAYTFHFMIRNEKYNAIKIFTKYNIWNICNSTSRKRCKCCFKDICNIYIDYSDKWYILDQMNLNSKYLFRHSFFPLNYINYRLLKYSLSKRSHYYNFSIDGNKYFNPLEKAVSKLNYDVVKLLIDHGADIHLKIKYPDNKYALIYAYIDAYGNDSNLLKFLVNNGLPLDNDNGSKVLMHILHKFDYDKSKVKDLLDLGATYNEKYDKNIYTFMKFGKDIQYEVDHDLIELVNSYGFYPKCIFLN